MIAQEGEALVEATKSQKGRLEVDSGHVDSKSQTETMLPGEQINYAGTIRERPSIDQNQSTVSRDLEFYVLISVTL